MRQLLWAQAKDIANWTTTTANRAKNTRATFLRNISQQHFNTENEVLTLASLSHFHRYEATLGLKLLYIQDLIQKRPSLSLSSNCFQLSQLPKLFFGLC